MSSNKLPLKNFKWVSQNELQNFKNETFILNLDDESDIGYYLEVDLEYPIHLHIPKNSQY